MVAVSVRGKVQVLSTPKVSNVDMTLEKKRKVPSNDDMTLEKKRKIPSNDSNVDMTLEDIIKKYKINRRGGRGREASSGMSSGGGRGKRYRIAADVELPKPRNLVPENAITMHPVMLLHQMKPAIAYIVNETTQDERPFLNISAECDGQTFYGEGTKLKIAKFQLAKEAIKVLYQVNSTFELYDNTKKEIV